MSCPVFPYIYLHCSSSPCFATSPPCLCRYSLAAANPLLRLQLLPGVCQLLTASLLRAPLPAAGGGLLQAHSCPPPVVRAALCLQLLADVYIFTDHMSGPQAGASPGYGVTLVAETTSGRLIAAEACAAAAGAEVRQSLRLRFAECLRA
jgi:hypothetical protein